MSTTLTERELTFDFPASWIVTRFDVPGRALPKHIMPVDFLVERADDVLLIEVKDPSNSRSPAENRSTFVKKMQSDELTHQELAPKARTSWSYLHLMNRTTKPLKFVVALGTDSLSIQPWLLQNLADRLRQRLAKEADTPWAVQYVDSCVVVPALDLGKFLDGVTVTRNATGT